MRDAEARILVARMGYGEPGWDLPGGRVEGDERPDEGLVREIREETGLDVAVERLVLVDTRRRGRIVFVFRCRCLGGTLTPAPVEIQELRWVTRAELADLPLKSDGRAVLALEADGSGEVRYLPLS